MNHPAEPVEPRNLPENSSLRSVSQKCLPEVSPRSISQKSTPLNFHSCSSCGTTVPTFAMFGAYNSVEAHYTSVIYYIYCESEPALTLLINSLPFFDAIADSNPQICNVYWHVNSAAKNVHRRYSIQRENVYHQMWNSATVACMCPCSRIMGRRESVDLCHPHQPNFAATGEYPKFRRKWPFPGFSY